MSIYEEMRKARRNGPPCDPFPPDQRGDADEADHGPEPAANDVRRPAAK